MHTRSLVSSLLLLSATVATASSSWFGGNSQAALQEDPEPVPGDNPLIFCGKTDDYMVTIDKVDLTPNPPAAGKNLTISASGTLKEKVEKGAYVHLIVKYGVIGIINTNADLCDYASEVGLECPLEKGKLDLTKIVALPAQIPPGKYTVTADVYTKDNVQMTCFNAAVSFSR